MIPENLVLQVAVPARTATDHVGRKPMFENNDSSLRKYREIRRVTLSKITFLRLLTKMYDFELDKSYKTFGLSK